MHGMQAGRPCQENTNDPQDAMTRSNAQTNRPLQRLAAAGVSLSICLLVGCQMGASPAAGATAASSANNEPGTACPAKDFDGFLKAFSSQRQLQDEHTEDQVWVQVISDEETYAVERVQVDKAQYSGFNLASREDGFHVLDGAGVADPTPVMVDMEKQEGGRYLVSFQYGSSEGRSYLFVPKENCWVLSEDRTPPSP